jgi:hypothetical protein
LSDPIIRGIKAGFWATIGDVVLHSLGFFIFKTTTTAQYISQLIFPLKEVTLIRYLYGELVHFGAGSLAGVVLALVLQKYGHEHPYYKGMGLGVLYWIVHIAVIPNIVNSPRPIVYRSELECLVDLLAHLSYGIISAFVLVKSIQRVKS